MWWSKPKTWYEVGHWLSLVGGKEYWIPLDRETPKRDAIIKFKTYRKAELELRRIREQGNLSKSIRLMDEDAPRVVCQHMKKDAENCTAYEHTYDGVMEAIINDTDF